MDAWASLGDEATLQISKLTSWMTTFQPWIDGFKELVSGTIGSWKASFSEWAHTYIPVWNEIGATASKIIYTATDYNAVFKLPEGEYLQAYLRGLEFFRKQTITCDYMLIITALMLLAVAWDYVNGGLMGALPISVQHALFSCRLFYHFATKIYPSLISLIILPYTIYMYMYVYHPGELGSFAPLPLPSHYLSHLLPPSYYLFGCCLMVNVVSLFYFSFRYIRSGFDMNWRISMGILAVVFACFCGLYEWQGLTYGHFPYKVLYKAAYTRVFVYIYVYNLLLVIFAAVMVIVFIVKQYHLKIGNPEMYRRVKENRAKKLKASRKTTQN